MIENYSPADYNVHSIQITFNKDGYTGHIVTKLGGNCTGASVLETALSFVEDCDDDDVNRLTVNDCDFKLHYDEDYWFSLRLHNANGDELIIDDADDDDLKNIIIGVEIVECTPDVRD